MSRNRCGARGPPKGGADEVLPFTYPGEKVRDGNTRQASSSERRELTKGEEQGEGHWLHRSQARRGAYERGVARGDFKERDQKKKTT